MIASTWRSKQSSRASISSSTVASVRASYTGLYRTGVCDGPPDDPPTQPLLPDGSPRLVGHTRVRLWRLAVVLGVAGFLSLGVTSTWFHSYADYSQPWRCEIRSRYPEVGVERDCLMLTNHVDKRPVCETGMLWHRCPKPD